MGEGCVCEVEECLLLRNRGIVLGRGDGGGCGGGGGGDEALTPPPLPPFYFEGSDNTRREGGNKVFLLFPLFTFVIPTISHPINLPTPRP